MFSWIQIFIKIFDINGKQLNLDKKITVGDNCWICSETMVLKGSTIPNNSVVSARSIVTKELTQEFSIYKNNAPIKSNIRWGK